MESSPKEKDHHQPPACQLNLYAKLSQLVNKYETLSQEIYEFKLPDSIHCSEMSAQEQISFYDYDNYEYFAIEHFQKEHEAFLSQLKKSGQDETEKKVDPKPIAAKSSYHASVSSSNEDYSLEMFYSVSDSFPSMILN